MLPTTAWILYLRWLSGLPCPHPCALLARAELALSMAVRKPLFLPECQSTFRPQLLFPLPPFFSLLSHHPPCHQLSLLLGLFLVFLLLAPGFPHYPPPCFLSTGYKWKTATPWSFASPSYCSSQRQPGLTLHPELVLVAPPLLPK